MNFSPFTTISKNKPCEIPFTDFGGNGEIIHFAHANGFPPGCYNQFVNQLKSRFKVIGMNQRPLWENSNPNELKNWNLLADDLIVFFEQKGLKNIIGMGHSMGATISIIAAVKRPDLFSKLVIIDPPGLFLKKIQWFNSLMPLALRKRFIPIAKISAKRRDRWDSQEEIYTSFRKKRVFKRFSNSTLWDLVKASTRLTKKGNYALTYSKEWETRIYITAPTLMNYLLKVKIPIIAIKGAKEAVVGPEIWQQWQAAQPQNEFLDFPNAGHLVPMEYPKELAEWILNRI